MSRCHEPLSSANEIRILKLEPAQNESDSICCSLQVTQVHDNLVGPGQYEALSYCWGPPEPQRTIQLNGYPFLITSNLDLALRRLRGPYLPRFLWVDAICIDQEDTQERSQQISLMRSIYASAARVIVWLGGSDKDIDEALNFIQNFDLSSTNPFNFVKSHDFPRRFASVEAGFTKLLNKPWWYRMWVVQEVFVTQRETLVGCGYLKLSFEHLIRVLWYPLTTEFTLKDRYLEGITSEKFWTLMNFIEWLMNSFEQHDGSREFVEIPLYIEDVLRYTRGREATDPRDQVYGILGLVTDAERGWFLPNYAEPVEQVYKEATIRCFQSSRNLCLLRLAQKVRSTLALPSWCIDFSASSLVSYQPKVDTEDFIRVITSDEPFRMVHDADQNTLTVPGVVLGRVTLHQNFPGYSGPFSVDKFLASFRNMLSFTSRMKHALSLRISDTEAEETYVTDAVLKTVFVKILSDLTPTRVVDELRKLIQRLTDPRESGDHISLSDYALFQDHTTDINGQSKTMTSMNPFRSRTPELPLHIDMFHQIFTDISEKALLVTSLGFMAKAEYHVGPEDVLCFLWGCNSPAVLRPEADESYRLITFAWLDGISRGEKSLTPYLEHRLAVNDLQRVQASMRELAKSENLEQRDICLR